MQISIITDEIHPDFLTAVRAGHRWGIGDYELRKTGGKRVPEIPQQAVDTILRTMAQYALRITALSPGLLKRPQSWMGSATAVPAAWWEREDLRKEYEDRARHVLQQTCVLARRFETSTVIIFTPEATTRGEGRPCPEAILKLLRRLACDAQQQGLTLALENEADCWADTGAHTAEILRAVNENNLKINWDPANAYLAGEVPYPDGYGHVRHHLVNVHAKDALPTTDPFQLDYELIGKGKIDWPGQIRALRAHSYAGFICIETHSHPLEARSEENLRILRELIATTGGS